MVPDRSPTSASAFLHRAVDCGTFILFAFSFFILLPRGEEAEK